MEEVNPGRIDSGSVHSIDKYGKISGDRASMKIWRCIPIVRKDSGKEKVMCYFSP
jgi:hypothetical protein